MSAATLSSACLFKRRKTPISGGFPNSPGTTFFDKIMNPSTKVKPSPLRLLILSPPNTDSSTPPLFRPFLAAITGSKPADEIVKFAGYTSHPPLQLRTKYYQRDVGIWCDEIPLPKVTTIESSNRPGLIDRSLDESEVSSHSGITASGGVTGSESTPASLDDWKSQLLSSDPEAAEVRSVIGGIILLLPVSTSTAQSLPEHFHALLETVHALREAIEDESPGRDIASLVVLQPTSSGVPTKVLNDLVEKCEDHMLQEGWFAWDIVAWDGQVPASTQHGEASASNQIPSNTSMGESDDQNSYENTGRNEYNEKTGLPHVLEVLESIDWTISPDYGEDPDDPTDEFDFEALATTDDEFGDTGPSPSKTKPRGILNRDMFSTSGGIDFELQREMMELKMSMLEDRHSNSHPDEKPAIDEPNDLDHDQDAQKNSRTAKTGQPQQHLPNNEDEDEDSQITHFPALIDRVVAIREAGADMSKVEREKFAKREIARIMREMG